jgi:phage tail-like protein
MSGKPSSYLKYLPAVYNKPSDAFLGDYLKIFEKLLTGIDDAQLSGRKGIQQLLHAEVIGNLFYPRLSFLFDDDDQTFMPDISGATPKKKAELLAVLDSYIGAAPDPHPLGDFLTDLAAAHDPQAACLDWLNDFLGWLGRSVALMVDNNWTIDKKRSVIAQIMALYRQRGTAQGLGFLVDLLLDLPMSLSGVDRNQDPVVGELKVIISNPVLDGIQVGDDRAHTFIVRDSYPAGGQVIAGFLPWSFNILLTLPNYQNGNFILTATSVQQILALVARLRQLLDSAKPAASRFTITIQPSMALNPTSTQLGVNTLLGTQGP